MRLLPLIAGFVVTSVATTALAQVVGEFRWQTQPFCNVLTLTVVQQGAQFQLSGSDDLCGAGPAPVTGTALVAGNSVAMGVTIALPSGAPAHLSASITLATVSGSWNDADGRTGSFVFNTATGGSPRPAPATAALITAAQLAPAIFAGTGAAATVARSDHDHDARYAGRLVRLQVSPWGLAQHGVGTDLPLASIGGCAGTPAFFPVMATLPLSIPSGAEVTSAVVSVYDFGNGVDTVSLIADTVGASGMGATMTLATAAASAGSNGTVTLTLTPTTRFVVEGSTTLRLNFRLTGIGVCNVELLYALPAVD